MEKTTKRKPEDFLGITKASPEYRRLRETLHALQEGMCAICRSARRKPVFDHHHATGHARNALCATCNSLLGVVENRISGWGPDGIQPWVQALRAAPLAARAYVGNEEEWATDAQAYVRKWHTVLLRLGNVYAMHLGPGNKPKPSARVSRAVFQDVAECLITASKEARRGKSDEAMQRAQRSRQKDWAGRWLASLQDGPGKGEGWTWGRFTSLTAIMTMTLDSLADIHWREVAKGDGTVRVLACDLGWVDEDGATQVWGYEEPEEA